jgi:hypothetical protein
MPTISISGGGSVACDYIREQAYRGEGLIVTTRQRVGHSGAVAHITGSTDGGGSWMLTEIGTNAVVEAWARAVEALVGQIVSVTDDRDVTRSNVLINHVSPLQKSRFYQPGTLITTKGIMHIRGVVV